MRRSKILEQLRAGKCALMTMTSLGPSPLTVGIAGMAGMDAVWIDMEHRPFGPHQVAEMIAAARLYGVDPVVRVRKGEGYTSFFRPLEDGAAGIIVPHVITREEAEWVARNAKFPPQGRRGIEIVMPDADLSFSDPREFMAHANRETFVCIQIEDAEALDNLDTILSVPGIELVFIGPADLSASLGIPFQLEHRLYVEAVQRIARAAAKHGQWWGLPVKDAAAAAAYAAQGARFFNIGSDFMLLKNGFLRIRDEFDRALAAD